MSLYNFLNECKNNDRFTLIIAEPGGGKTFMVNHVVQYYLENNMFDEYHCMARDKPANPRAAAKPQLALQAPLWRLARKRASSCTFVQFLLVFLSTFMDFSGFFGAFFSFRICFCLFFFDFFSLSAKKKRRKKALSPGHPKLTTVMNTIWA